MNDVDKFILEIQKQIEILKKEINRKLYQEPPLTTK